MDRTIEDLIPEKNLIEMYGLKRSQLAAWRQSGLRGVRLGRGNFAYWQDDLVFFLSEKSCVVAASESYPPRNGGKVAVTTDSGDIGG